MDSARLAQMVDFLQVGDRNLHSVLVLRNGWVVAEAYSHPYTAATPHSLYSCTKSVISLLIGIALTRGVLTGISQPVADFFPWLSAPGQDPRKGRITIDHLLQMSAGLDWRESNIAYSSKRNTLMQMMRSQDWTRFVLERPPVADPGQRFDYSSGLSHVLSAILQAASGQSTLQFAQEHLLSPLGIGESVYWAADPAGVTTGGWGLQLTTRELARIGRLCGQQGRWQDQEIVAPGWIKRSTQARRQVVDGSSLTYRIWSLARRLQRRPAPKVSRIGYGQHWWIPSFGGYAARGRGGQALFILPNADLVVACTGGLARRDVLLPEKLVADFILPAVVANRPLPAAPESAASLAATCQRMAQPGPAPPEPLPATAAAISRSVFWFPKTYPAMRAIALRFGPAGEAGLEITRQEDTLELRMGLDGLYRTNQLGEEQGTAALRGTWRDEHTFVLEWLSLASGDKSVTKLVFQSGRVSMTTRSTMNGRAERVVGREGSR